MDGTPQFRLHGSNLVLEPTAEAVEFAKCWSGRDRAQDVESDAEDALAQMGFDAATCTERQILSQSSIQLVQYQSKTFQWAMKNAAGWTVGDVTSAAFRIWPTSSCSHGREPSRRATWSSQPSVALADRHTWNHSFIILLSSVLVYLFLCASVLQLTHSQAHLFIAQANLKAFRSCMSRWASVLIHLWTLKCIVRRQLHHVTLHSFC
jgi:hypothetical protein